MQAEDVRHKQVQSPGSLLLLQTLLYFDWHYTLMVFIGTLGLQLFKLYALPYP